MNNEIDHWEIQYRFWQETLASKYLIPALREWSVPVSKQKVLEVGCGDAGCAAMFAREGCTVTAIDIVERSVMVADQLNKRAGIKMRMHVGDISTDDCPGLNEGPFDLILMRDVVEHLEELEKTLNNLKKHLADDGKMFIVFPPYYSPYGGHQHMLPRKKLGLLIYNKLPSIQLLPDVLFQFLVRTNGTAYDEVMRIRGIRLTLHKFEGHVRKSGLTVLKSKKYILRPMYAIRYHTPIIPASFIGQIPFLRELLVSEGGYLLGKKPY